MPVSSPAFHVGLLPNRPIQETVAMVRELEELGLEGAWIADSQSIFRDGLIALAAAAAATSSIEIASGVTNAVTRHLAVLASSFATLQELSAGRAVLGIGGGESALQTIGARRTRLKELEETIEALRGLMRGEEVEVNGVVNRLTWSDTEVPIIIASSGPKSLQLSGRVADGVLFQVGADPNLARYAIDNVKQGADEAGRSLDELRICCRLACSVSADREWAREQARGYVAAAGGTTFGAVPRERIPDDLAADLAAMKERYDYYEHASSEAAHKELVTERMIDGIAVAGSPEEAVPRLQALMDLGVDTFVLVSTGDDPLASIRTLAADVLPHLRRAADKAPQ